MSLTKVNVGSLANDHTGTKLRNAFQLVNLGIDQIDTNTSGIQSIETQISEIPINDQIVNYVLDITDNLKMVIVTNANASTITVPPDVFDIGASIVVVAGGSGQVEIIEGSGVVINSADDALKLRTQFSTGNLTQISLNTWLLSGDLEV